MMEAKKKGERDARDGDTTVRGIERCARRHAGERPREKKVVMMMMMMMMMMMKEEVWFVVVRCAKL